MQVDPPHDKPLLPRQPHAGCPAWFTYVGESPAMWALRAELEAIVGPEHSTTAK